MSGLPDVVASVTFISGAAGTILTLLASYVPGFREKFASLPPTAKQLWMLLAIAVVTGCVALLSFTHVWQLVPATREGAVGLVVMFVETVIANQAVYQITPQTQAVKKAKNASRGLTLSRH
jgi:hypothetical protein